MLSKFPSVALLLSKASKDGSLREKTAKPGHQGICHGDIDIAITAVRYFRKILMQALEQRICIQMLSIFEFAQFFSL